MRKLLLSIIIFFAILISLILLFQNKIAKSYLDKELNEFNTSSQYFHYQELNVNLFGRKIELDEIEYFNEKKGIQFSAPKIEVKGISLYKILFKKVYQVNSFILDNPTLDYHKKAKNQNDSNKNSTTDISIRIKHFNLTKGDFNIILDSNKSLTTKDLSLKVSDFEFGTKDGTKPFIYEAFEGDCDSLSYTNPSNQLKVSSLSFDSKKQLKIGQLKFNNQSENIRIATDLSMELYRLSFDFNYDSLLYSQRIYADSIAIDSFIITAIGNQVQPKSTQHTSWQVVESLNKVKMLQYLGKLALHNGRINYETYSPSGEKLNSIYFNQLNANFTNLDKKMQQDSIATLAVKSKFMDVCQLNLTVDFNLKSTDEAQHIRGRVKAFDPARLNPLFLQMANVKIKSGYIDDFAFNFYLNQVESNGDLDLKYHDLKIKIPDDKNKRKINLDFAKEFVANTLALNNNNKKDQNLVVGKINFQREKEKSVFNYWWKSLASGIKDVVLNPSVKNKK